MNARNFYLPFEVCAFKLICKHVVSFHCVVMSKLPNACSKDNSMWTKNILQVTFYVFLKRFMQ